MKNGLIIIALFFVVNSNAQLSNALAGGINVSVPQSSIRQADVMWMKTVWRKIDLRQKMNHSLYFPSVPGSQNRYSLFDYIKNDALKDPSFKLYDPGVMGTNDMFTDPMSKSQIDSLFTKTELVVTPSLDRVGEFDTVTVTTSLSRDDIKGYEIKEQWFFDKQRSTMDVRIIGICPIITIHDKSTGEYKGEKPLFWIYFPEAKYAMAQWPFYNANNEFEGLSYEDVFIKRKFASRIIKVSNVYDRYIDEYMAGTDALLESDKLQNELFIMEHDLWSY